MLISGNSSVGRAQPCQGWGREFESRFPLQILKSPNLLIWAFFVITNQGFGGYYALPIILRDNIARLPFYLFVLLAKIKTAQSNIANW